jgi:HAD superfamily hydrolase (TIGR01509 family)
VIKALIFDFDGLIIDSESPEFEAWHELFAEYGRELGPELWADLVGRPPTHFDLYGYFCKHIDPVIEVEKLRQDRRARVIALTITQPILPGVEEYLQSATALGLRIGLASSSTRDHVRGHLHRLKLLDYFHSIRCFEDTDRHKPDPTPYLKVLEDLGAKADEAIALEDSPNGVAAAKAAGIFCVAVPNPITCRLPLEHADHRLASLAEEPLEKIILRATANKGR